MELILHLLIFQNNLDLLNSSVYIDSCHMLNVSKRSSPDFEFAQISPWGFNYWAYLDMLLYCEQKLSTANTLNLPPNHLIIKVYYLFACIDITSS